MSHAVTPSASTTTPVAPDGAPPSCWCTTRTRTSRTGLVATSPGWGRVPGCCCSPPRARPRSPSSTAVAHLIRPAIGPTLPFLASAARADGLPRVLPAPKPIAGGIQIPGGPFIHVFAPGPTTVTLPFTGLQLQGLDVEPSVITHYRGFTALAFHVGTATGSDGRTYNLETDMRAMEGTYIAEDGSRQRGLFALI